MVVSREDALGVQHLGVREAACDVGAPEALVEVDAGRVAFDQIAHRLRKQGRPGLGLLGELVVVVVHGWAVTEGVEEGAAYPDAEWRPALSVAPSSASMALFSKRRAPEDQPKTSIWRESIELSTLLGFAPTQVKAAPMPTLFDPGVN